MFRADGTRDAAAPGCACRPGRAVENGARSFPTREGTQCMGAFSRSSTCASAFDDRGVLAIGRRALVLRRVALGIQVDDLERLQEGDSTARAAPSQEVGPAHRGVGPPRERGTEGTLGSPVFGSTSTSCTYPSA